MKVAATVYQRYVISLLSLKYQNLPTPHPSEVTDGQFRAEECADTSIVAKLSASESITDDMEADQLEEASTITEGKLGKIRLFLLLDYFVTA